MAIPKNVYISVTLRWPLTLTLRDNINGRVQAYVPMRHSSICDLCVCALSTCTTVQLTVVATPAARWPPCCDTDNSTTNRCPLSGSVYLFVVAWTLSTSECLELPTGEFIKAVQSSPVPHMVSDPDIFSGRLLVDISPAGYDYSNVKKNICQRFQFRVMLRVIELGLGLKRGLASFLWLSSRRQGARTRRGNVPQPSWLLDESRCRAARYDMQMTIAPCAENSLETKTEIACERVTVYYIFTITFDLYLH